MKKHLFRATLVATAALTFVGCSDDDNNDELDVTLTCTFEQASLDASTNILIGRDLATNGIYNGTLYTEGVASVDCYYTNGWGSDYAAGFTISGNFDRETAGYTNQYSVYATSGYNGSSRFALAYYDSYSASTGNAGAIPTVNFAQTVTPQNVWVNNNTYAYLWWTTGAPDYAEAPAVEDVTLTAKGYLAGELVGETSMLLVDATSKTYVGEWTKFDLSSLGSVDKIEFHYSCSNYLAPAYFCIDNLSYQLSPLYTTL
jgi:hypothetical protein